MSITFLNDQSLYTDFAYYQSQFNWGVNEKSPQLILYHCYWSGILSDLHELCLKSLLVTQSPPFEVWVWMPPDDISRNQTIAANIQRAAGVKFKEYIPEEESKGTPFEGQLDLLQGQVRSNINKAGPSQKDRNRLKWRRLADVANAFRILVLGKYGGVYFDLDLLFLKDFRPLCNVEFFYQWSDQQYGNNAVLHFFKNSHNIWRLAQRSVELKNGRSPALLRFDDLSKILKDVYVFPSFLFDPIWIAHDRGIRLNNYCNKFEEFFASEASTTLAEFFPGAYAYHWHNQWDVPIKPNTIIWQLYIEVQSLFETDFHSDINGRNDIVKDAI
jgi:hypothetical protein